MRLLFKMKESKRIKSLLYLSIIFFLFFYILSMPIFGQSTSILRFIVYLSMGLLGVSTIVYTIFFGKFEIHPLLFTVPLFALFALIGTTIYSHDFRSWFSLILLSLSFFILFFAYKSIKSRFLVLNIILSSLFVFSLIFILHYRNELMHFKLFGDKDFRLGAYFDNPNNISIFSLFGYSIALYLLLFFKNKLRYVYLVPLFTLLVMGFSTGSRMFLIGFLLFTLTICFIRFKRHKFIFFGLLFSFILVLLVFINLPFMATMRSRLIRSINTIFGIGERVDTSTIERTIWGDYGIYLGSKHLFFGFGSKGFAAYSGTETYAHNNYSEVLCDFGLFGFILFYLPLVCFALMFLFSKKNKSRGLAIPYVLYYFVSGFFNVFYYNKIYYLVLAFLSFLLFTEEKNFFRASIVQKVNKMLIICDKRNHKENDFQSHLSETGIVCCLIIFDSKNKHFSYDEIMLKELNINVHNGGRLFTRRIIKKFKPDVIINTTNSYFDISLLLFLCKIPYFNLVKAEITGISFINILSINNSAGLIIENYDVRYTLPRRIIKNARFLQNWNRVSVVQNDNELINYILSIEKDFGGL